MLLILMNLGFAGGGEAPAGPTQNYARIARKIQFGR